MKIISQPSPPQNTYILRTDITTGHRSPQYKKYSAHNKQTTTNGKMNDTKRKTNENDADDQPKRNCLFVGVGCFNF